MFFYIFEDDVGNNERSTERRRKTVEMKDKKPQQHWTSRDIVH